MQKVENFNYVVCCNLHLHMQNLTKSLMKANETELFHAAVDLIYPETSNFRSNRNLMILFKSQVVFLAKSKGITMKGVLTIPMNDRRLNFEEKSWLFFRNFDVYFWTLLKLDFFGCFIGFLQFCQKSGPLFYPF